MGPTGCPETPVKDYDSTLRNIPEERGSRQHRGGSLESRHLRLILSIVAFQRREFSVIYQLFSILRCCINFWVYVAPCCCGQENLARASLKSYDEGTHKIVDIVLHILNFRY